MVPAILLLPFDREKEGGGKGRQKRTRERKENEIDYKYQSTLSSIASFAVLVYSRPTRSNHGNDVEENDGRIIMQEGGEE